MNQTNDLIMIRKMYKHLMYAFSPKMILPLVFILIYTLGYAQNPVTIRGEVITHKDRQSLPGVSIREKANPASGTVTDMDGRFVLNVMPGTVLVFSYVGYLPTEVRVENQDFISVTLADDILSLEEFTVVGYGYVKRSDLTGSVSSIRPSDFENQPLNNVAATLQGRAPGVVVNRASGAPGSQTKIRIRGLNSISGNNDPLFVVDGMSIMSINDVNPNDIESVEILKDASATAIYGSRGANGVVLITTRKGTRDKTNVNFNNYYSTSFHPGFYNIMNGYEYANHEMLRREMAGISTDIYSEGYMDTLRMTGGTDWQREVYRTGMTRNSQLSVSGGTDNITYYISGNTNREEGIVRNTDFSSQMIRSNLDARINDWMNVGFMINHQRRNDSNTGDRGYKGSPMWSALVWSPSETVYNEDGSYKFYEPLGALSFNPTALINNRVTDTWSDATIYSADFRVKPFKGLELTTKYSTNNSNYGWDFFNNSLTQDGQAGVNAGRNSSRSNSWEWINILNYNTQINQHNLSFTGVFEESSITLEHLSGRGSNLLTESMGYYNIGIASAFNASTGYSRSALRSYLGRVNYGYKRYLLTLSYRYDGSSKLQGNNKWSGFPSAAFAWNLSDEPFIEALDLFSSLKLRASWGVTGSQAIAPYTTLGLLSSGRNFTYGARDAISMPGYGIGNPRLPDLEWEKTEQINFGLDFSFFTGRLSFQVDYFDKTTRDLHLETSIPAYSGGGRMMSNVGTINNSGVEATVGIVPVSRPAFNWNLSLNGTYLQNKVVSLGEEEILYFNSGYVGGFIDGPVFVLEVGKPFGAIYGFKFLGIWQEDEAEQAALFNRKPGDEKYKDINGDGLINADDKEIIGYAYPDFVFGFNNNISYRNWDLNVFLQGVAGNQILNAAYAATMLPKGDSRTITHRDGLNYWTPTNTNTDVANIGSTASEYHPNSSRFVQDASYIRLQNLTLAYTLRRDISRIGDIKVFLSGQNLFVLTNYKGSDPEAQTHSSGDRDMRAGIDAGAYPNPRVFTLGVNFSL